MDGNGPNLAKNVRQSRLKQLQVCFRF